MKLMNKVSIFLKTEISKSTKLQHIFISYSIGIPTSATVREHCETSKDSIYLSIFIRPYLYECKNCETVPKTLSIFRRLYLCDCKRAL